MECKTCKRSPTRRDKCMVKLINSLNEMGMTTLASCCGHGKYPMTIVTLLIVNKKPKSKGWNKFVIELISGKVINRTTRFYKKDKQGLYYIPETIN